MTWLSSNNVASMSDRELLIMHHAMNQGVVSLEDAAVSAQRFTIETYLTIGIITCLTLSDSYKTQKTEQLLNQARALSMGCATTEHTCSLCDE